MGKQKFRDCEWSGWIRGEHTGGNESESVEGDVWIDGVDFRESAGDHWSISAGCDDVGVAGHFAAEAEEDFADEASISVDGADLHGVGGGFPDGGGWLYQLDFGKECGFSGEVSGHGAEAGGDDAAAIGGLVRDDVEGDGGAEVDDDGGCAVAVEDADGVGEAVGTDLGWEGVVDGHADGAGVAELVDGAAF